MACEELFTVSEEKRGKRRKKKGEEKRGIRSCSIRAQKAIAAREEGGGKKAARCLRALPSKKNKKRKKRGVHTCPSSWATRKRQG